MKRVALLLGINNYRDPGIQDLQCAGNGTVAFASRKCYIR